MRFPIYLNKPSIALVSELGLHNVVFLTDIFILVYLCFYYKSQREHLCARLTAASWILEPFGEIGVNFSLQHSLRTHFAKISNKKSSPKINVKHKKTTV